MIENLNILLQLFIFLIFFSTPLNLYNKHLVFKKNYISAYDCIFLNIIFHCNLFLFISFLNFNLKIYFYTILFANVLFNFYYLKKFFKFNLNLNGIYFFILFLIVNFSIFVDISANLKLEWDALSHWIFKVRNFYDGIEIQNLINLQFPEYPHLGTFIWAFFWKNSNLEYEYFGRLFYVFLYLVSLFSINKYIFKDNFYFSTISIIFIIILSYDPFLFSGYQEYLLFSILVCISRFIFIIRKNLKYFLIFISIAHLLMWFKDEGLFYFLIFSCILLFFSKLTAKDKVKMFILILLLPVIQFTLQNYIIGNYSFQANIIHSNLGELLNFKIFFNKFYLITKFILISFVKYKLMIVIILSQIFVYYFYRNYLPFLKFFLIFLIINYGLFFAIYLHTPHDLNFLLKVTLDRLIFQTSGFYLIIFLVLLRKLFQTFYNRTI